MALQVHDHWHCRHNFLSHLQFFKVGEIVASEIWLLDVTRDITR